ncbi:DUF4197 domain-containing protein [Ramlibacter tataouinensis]|nr:DUF4197 domain-containing protein [Ramlibacter tataouinensis]
MNRRQFLDRHAAGAALALALLQAASLARAQDLRSIDLASISEFDASRGLKAALENGALAAVRLLGVPDGFLANPRVRIPLPGWLQDAAGFLRAVGQRRRLDELELAMNRAAESAVPLARNLLVDAVQRMSVVDAKNILTGGDTSVTRFFADKTRAPLAAQFLPVVQRATEKVGLAGKYNRLAAQAQGLGLVRNEDPSIQHYVTRKSLDGLYLVIGEEERKLRQNPAAAGSALLSKVFGALR